MHIYFSGIGGAGIGPLALIAHQAGFEVSGSDSQNSQYIDSLRKQGIRLHIGQTEAQIAKEHEMQPIDWIVFSSAVVIDNPNNEEMAFAKKHKIKISKRDELLNSILEQKDLKLVAIAGTHGKTTTTALAVWLLKELDIPVSYSVGAKTIFGPMGQYNPVSKYFVYECDEFDRNFLSFEPEISIITVVDWDHHDIYKTREEYKKAFRDFIDQSHKTFIFKKDADYLGIKQSKSVTVLPDNGELLEQIKLVGIHNRQNAKIAISAVADITKKPLSELAKIACKYPGSSRRFEKIANGIYSDYAHTPEEIKATMQMARELSDNIVAVYEPLTNRRQHYMREQYQEVFKGAKKVYWLPSYLAREDPNLPVLTPEELIKYLKDTDVKTSIKSPGLARIIEKHAKDGDLVICMAGGGGGSLDEWLREQFSK